MFPMTTIESLLLECVKNLESRHIPTNITWEWLCQRVTELPQVYPDNLTWGSWIPAPLAKVWNDLPLEMKIGAYIIAEEAARFANDRDDLD
jgi:hypothetical protein